MKNRKLTIALAQMQSVSGDIDANMNKIVQITADAASQGADIICFPELAYCGYFLSSEELQRIAEPVDGPFVQALSHLAKEHRIHILAGYAETCSIPGRIYNSCVFVDDKGNFIGNMRKVYAWGKEKSKFRCGNKFPVFDTKFGKIGILICYDAEYPEPARIQALKGAELVFVPSVWSIPASRRWEVDISANALFNLMFVAGANTVSEHCCGSSMVSDPYGVFLARASTEKEELIICEIDLDEVIRARSKIPYMNDYREDTFSIDAVKNY